MKLHCYFDGGYDNLNKRNGYCSYAIYEVENNHKRLAELVLKAPLPTINSSNQAEYSGLILLLDSINNYIDKSSDFICVTDIIIYTDSKLVEGQISGKFKVRSENLKILYNKAIDMFSDFNNTKIEWVTRKVMLEIFGH